MIITHTPAGGEAEHYDTSTLKVSETSTAGAAIDMRWPRLKAALYEGDPEAMRVVAWVLQKRANPTMRLRDFDPPANELTVGFGPDDVARYCEAVAEASSTPEETEEAYGDIVRNAADREAAEKYIADFRARR